MQLAILYSTEGNLLVRGIAVNQNPLLLVESIKVVISILVIRPPFYPSAQLVKLLMTWERRKRGWWGKWEGDDSVWYMGRHSNLSTVCWPTYLYS